MPPKSPSGLIIIFSLFFGVAIFLGDAHAADDLDKIVQSIGDSIQKAGKKTIAVVDFSDLQGNITELGRYLAEEFSVRLAGADKGFEVIDRAHLKAILVENKLSSTGLIDPATARKLGQIIGVESLITGTITPFGESVKLAVKILDTNTAKIVGATSAEIAKTKGIEDLLSRGINNSVAGTNQSIASFSPATRSANIIRVESNNFIFILKNCKRTGNTLICDVHIINNESEDRKLRIQVKWYADSTRIIDNNGNTYIPSKSVLGNNSINESNEVDVLLAAGIPTNARLIFEDIKNDPEYLAMIDLSCVLYPPQGSAKYFRGQLRNVPIQK